MSERHWLGDLSFAVLLALTLLALSRPQAASIESHSSTAAAKLTSADRVPTAGRIGLLS